jgi:hypothetical protein
MDAARLCHLEDNPGQDGRRGPRRCRVQGNHLKRLAKCARTLPRGYVEKTISRMKANIQGVIDAKGYHAKRD